MVSTLIHLEPQQKRRLMTRARKRGTSLSHEVREAIDLHLQLSPNERQEMARLVEAANLAADNSLARLDAAIAAVDRALRLTRKKAS